MTVAELIEKLQEMPQDWTVTREDQWDGRLDIVGVRAGTAYALDPCDDDYLYPFVVVA